MTNALEGEARAPLRATEDRLPASPAFRKRGRFNRHSSGGSPRAGRPGPRDWDAPDPRSGANRRGSRPRGERCRFGPLAGSGRPTEALSTFTREPPMRAAPVLRAAPSPTPPDVVTDHSGGVRAHVTLHAIRRYSDRILGFEDLCDGLEDQDTVDVMRSQSGPSVSNSEQHQTHPAQAALLDEVGCRRAHRITIDPAGPDAPAPAPLDRVVERQINDWASSGHGRASRKGGAPPSTPARKECL